jgi:hypothetical protein
VRADEPVARDHHRQRVSCVGTSDRSRAVREPEPQRLLGVRPRLAVRDLDERAPRALLEGRPRGIEWEVEQAAPSGEVLGELLRRSVDERARPDRAPVAPVEPLEAALRGNDPQRAELSQRSAPSSRRSCTLRSSPPA